MPKIRIKNLSKIVNAIYIKHIFSNDNDVQIIYGGSSSGKSYSQAQKVVLDVMKGRNYLIVRQVKDTIRRSVFNEVTEKIGLLRLKQFFSWNKSDLIISCANGCQILFAGLDDVEKIKSIKPQKGVITDIWIEEATETALKDIKQLRKRLRGRSDFKKRLILTFNPIQKDHWIFTEFMSTWWRDPFDYGDGLEYLDSDKYKELQYQEKDGISVLHTTFKDNAFLTEQDTQGLINENDKYYFEVYTLGKSGVLGATIFKNYKVEEFDKNSFDKYRYGLDWGFSVDPFAFVEIAIDLERKKIWVCNELYQTDMSNEESAQKVKKYITNDLVYCDSAEPKSISEYKNLGINARGVKKGKGSIESGIKFLQKMEIVIHPDCKNTLSEIKRYKWKEDKGGNVIPKPADKQADHLLDALRYSIEADIPSMQTQVTTSFHI